MSVRPILRWPDRRLRMAAAPVEGITDDIRAIWTDMIDTMEAMICWGLAAPQIGVMLRLAVVDTSDDRGHAVRLANPEILAASSDTWELTEGSPCLPIISAPVRRPSSVRVRFVDETGETVERDFTGLDAVSVQHQIDHLDGRLYIDRLSKVKRDMLLRRLKKAGI